MTDPGFDSLLAGPGRGFVLAAIRAGLDEDGPDLTSDAVFGPDDRLNAVVVAKAAGVVAGLPLIPMVLDELEPGAGLGAELLASDGLRTSAGITPLARLEGSARTLLRAERVMLNLLGHLSGVATLTAAFVERLAGCRTRLLDTRKTLPGLRHLQKYAVRVGGGVNHRMNLSEMLMLKDNHIDRAGSITSAVKALRAAYAPCPPIEVECRTLDEVREAVGLGVHRIMLDNMGLDAMGRALALIPPTIESEVSGGVTLDTVAAIGRLGPDYVSAGALTHSAPALDVSMRIALAA